MSDRRFRTLRAFCTHSVAVCLFVGVVSIGTGAWQQSPSVPPVPSLPTPVEGLPTQPTSYQGPWLYFLGALVSALIPVYFRWLDEKKRERLRQESIEDLERTRKWEAEDRERIAKELAASTARAAESLKRKAEEEAVKARDSAAEVARHILQIVEAKHADMSRKIDQNTQVSVDAFRESNAINEKIARIGAAFDVVQLGGRRATDATRPEALQVLEAVMSEHHKDDPAPKTTARGDRP